jgi:hypothetical protein
MVSRPAGRGLIAAAVFALALIPSVTRGQSSASPAASPPAPSPQVRQLAHGLASAAGPYLDVAHKVLSSAVEEIGAGGPARATVEQAWAAQFAPAALEAELVTEISSRFTAADEAGVARWNSSLTALRLDAARALADPPPSVSLDPRALAGDDAERWRLAERMVDVCAFFERATTLMVSVNYRASLAALRIVALSESLSDAQRQELEQGLAGRVDANRPALRERALRSTFLASRKATPADLAAEVEFFASPAGQAKCRAQTDSLESVLLRRIDALPAAVAALAPPAAATPAAP